MAYTLPVISEELSLHPQTDITSYVPKLLENNKKKVVKGEEEKGEEEKRVNFANNTFLHLEEESKIKKNQEKL